MLNNTTILVVEPGEISTNPLVAFFKKQTKARILYAKDPTEGLEIIKNDPRIELLLTDLFLPNKSGLELIRKGVGKNPGLVPIVIMPPGTRRHIAESLQAGAYFYIGTPYDYQEVLEVIKNGFEYQKLLTETLHWNTGLRKSDGFAGIIGESAVMKSMFKTIEMVTAYGHGNVLLEGESGTGKELVSQAIHDMTPGRNRHNFVPVNCAAIPDDLLESELFGYDKGAFTGANRSKKGRLQHADKGTLFLDEIGDMKPGLQAKMLRVLQEHVFEPIGSVKSIEIDIRVVAATNYDLDRAVEKGTFREDLYYRLCVVPITLPPLRERTDDIPHLIKKFLLLYNRGRRHAIQDFTPRALQRLKQYDWPGNVRELKNLVQRMCILHSGKRVDAENLPEKFKKDGWPEKNSSGEAENHSAEALDFHAMTTDYENRLILQALNTANWNKKEAAGLLNMKRTTLLEKIKKRNLNPD
ncbi:MAG: sigma-54 dependent transcriptional regulator [Desulfohalobiaceae bacterium]|nr:sigma-54 dependent transcriptional regulator [Desulfohalobiaceae bacterium]